MTAADIMRLKELLPTSLGTSEIREKYAREILERSVSSARMMAADYLDTIRETCASVLEGGISQSAARDALEEHLERLGFTMDEPSMENAMSMRRLNLIIDTQTAMAASISRLAEENPTLTRQYPAWHLTRLEPRSVPREDWGKRWKAAGDSVGWEGAREARYNAGYAALKSSPIWQALGDGVGGFDDTLGNPYPPFAFGSGLGWMDIDAEEAKAAGLVPGYDEEKPLNNAFAGLDANELLRSARKHGLIV